MLHKLVLLLAGTLIMCQTNFIEGIEDEQGSINLVNEIVDQQNESSEEIISKSKRCCCKNNRECQLGNSGFSTNDSQSWYNLTLSPFPNSSTFSLNRNRGSTQGDVQLTSSGLKFNTPGNYAVTLSGTVRLAKGREEEVLLNLFLVQNGFFDPNNLSTIFSANVVRPNAISTLNSSGILQNVEAGSEISIQATLGGTLEDVLFKVIAWEISAFKIPCTTPTKHHFCYKECSEN